jgi:hypothetical protein
LFESGTEVEDAFKVGTVFQLVTPPEEEQRTARAFDRCERKT